VTRLLVLLALVGVGLLLVDRPRRRSYMFVVMHTYRCMDEALGIKSFELDRRAKKRRGVLAGILKAILGPLGFWLVDYLWPPTQFGGVAALPFFHRRLKYVTLHLLSVPWPKRYHVWHVQGVTARWTTEIDANVGGFLERAERRFADALFLKRTGSTFDTRDHRDDNPPTGRLTIMRAKPAPAPPTGVPFEEVASE
jgi:hypothetical protein